MKVNTDGVLLGALVKAKDPGTILDIGTGTGVIALMLAQRFPTALVDAVEINKEDAETAKNNFHNSPFSDRCTCYPNSFEQYFADHPGEKYDLIVSNPPFFINSLKSATAKKEAARHTTMQFFVDLLAKVSESLNHAGLFSLILPVDIADTVTQLALNYGLYLQDQKCIASFQDSAPHRKVISLAKEKRTLSSQNVVIYQEPRYYTDQYTLLLKDFLTIF